MTPNLSDNSWAKAGLVAIVVVVVVGLWAYLAGGIFLIAFGRRFDEATPVTVYQYWYHYGAVLQVRKWLAIASGSALAILLAPGLLFLSPARRSLFGDARFATLKEIRKGGLLGEDGLIVGRLGNWFTGYRYLMFPGSQHAMLSAPTRSGKGIGIVIPNLLHWPESVVVLDIKQENWKITSAYRHRHGQECYLFSPTAADYRTHRYNPLSYISSDPIFRIDDIQKIGNMLFPDQAGTDAIWTATPRSLFLGIVLFLIETPGKPVTLGQVLRETLAEGDGAAHFAKAIKDRSDAGNALSGACVRALNSYISIASDNTRSGVIGGFRSRLELWMNPLVDMAASANDFDLREVRKRRMSIYLGVTPDNLERMTPLLNLFFQQLIDLNTRDLPSKNKAIQYRCLLLMDEFTAIGKIPILAKGIGYIAGYGLRMMPIIQSPAQLAEAYGREAAQSFQTNHALQIIYPPKASETQCARDISEWLAYQTVKGVSESKAKGAFAKKVPTASYSDQRRALMLPQEITGLGKGRQLVIVEDMPPILARKVKYFEDRVFIDRLKEVSASLRVLGRKLASQAELEAAIEAGELSAPVPMILLRDRHCLTDQEKIAPVATLSATLMHKGLRECPVTSADIPNFAKLGLDSFAIDFSSVPMPTAMNLDETALFAYADDLCRQAGIPVHERRR